MPWCDDCEKYWAPSAMTPEGACPTCGADLETPAPRRHRGREGPVALQAARRRPRRVPRIPLLRDVPRLTGAFCPRRSARVRPVSKDRTVGAGGSIARTHGLWRSLVSAPVWGTGGREFKSPQPDGDGASRHPRLVARRDPRGGGPGDGQTHRHGVSARLVRRRPPTRATARTNNSGAARRWPGRLRGHRLLRVSGSANWGLPGLGADEPPAPPFDGDVIFDWRSAGRTR